MCVYEFLSLRGPDSGPGPREAGAEKHQGTWIGVSFRHDGQESPANVVRTITRTVENDHVVWKRKGKNFAARALALDPGTTPKAIIDQQGSAIASQDGGSSEYAS